MQWLQAGTHALLQDRAEWGDGRSAPILFDRNLRLTGVSGNELHQKCHQTQVSLPRTFVVLEAEDDK